MYMSPHQFLNYSINCHIFMPLLMTLCSLLMVTKYLVPSHALIRYCAKRFMSIILFNLHNIPKYYILTILCMRKLKFRQSIVTSPFTPGSQVCPGMSSPYTVAIGSVFGLIVTCHCFHVSPPTRLQGIQGMCHPVPSTVPSN